MSDFEKEAAKLKALIASEKELAILRVYHRSYKYPTEQELLHVDFEKDFTEWINEGGNPKKLVSLLRGTAQSIENTYEEN